MRRALIVGINDYPEVPLYSCVNDAKKMCDILSRNEDGSPNFECRTLLAPSGEVTRHVLRENIKELFYHEAEVSLFYFSGHGAVDGYGNGYIMPVDMIYKHPFACGINMKELQEVICKFHKREKPVEMILDCCYSGIATKGGKEEYDKNVKS